MNSFRRDFIALIFAALTGKKQTLSDSFDIAAGLDLAKHHSIIALYYRGIELCGIQIPAKLKSCFSEEYCKALFASEQQLYELNILFKHFEEAQIRYLPLKGTVLKSMYPSTELRSMGDADILICLEQYPAVQKIMEKLGYRLLEETDHELIWKKGCLMVELHKCIMTQENRDYYRYFGQGWERAVPHDGSSRYDFSNEDFYIYVFVHLTKHYRISGIGIKHMLDIWICRKAFPDLDQNYVDQELKKMHLEDFHKNVLHTLEVWFSGGESDYKTNLITQMIFSSGEYGTKEMSNINYILRDTATSGSISHSKFNRTWKIMFLPYKLMCQKYRWLKKLPFLLPAGWVIRWVDILFFKRSEFKKYRSALKKIDRDSVDAHRLALAAVGISFDFEETV